MIGRLRTLTAVVGCLLIGGHASAQLTNPSFEMSGANPPTFTGWDEFGNTLPNIFQSSINASEGTFHVEMFGQFTFDMGMESQNDTGIFQDLPANPGERWQASADATHAGFDPLVGGDTGIVIIEFRDATDMLLSSTATTAVTAASPTDTYQNAAATAIAPAGTTNVRILLLLVQLGQPFRGGTVYWDNADLVQLPPLPAAIDNGGFETAGSPTFNAWGEFGNDGAGTIFQGTTDPTDGVFTCELVPNTIDPAATDKGVFQEIQAPEGRLWEASVFAGTNGLAGNDTGFMSIEFFDGNGNLIDVSTVNTLTAADGPTFPTQITLQAASPAATVSARLVLGVFHEESPARGSTARAIWYDVADLQDIGPAPVGLTNKSFEAVGSPAAGWSSFGNVFREMDLARMGIWHLKMFGCFCAPFNVSAATQDLPVNPWEISEVSAWAAHLTGDALAGQNVGILELQHVDANGETMTRFRTETLNSSSPTDVYTQFTAQGAAPPGAVSSRILVGILQPVVSDAGAIFYDDACMEVVGVAEPECPYNPGFEIDGFDFNPSGAGAIYPLGGWQSFNNFAGGGNIFRTDENPRSGGWGGVMFGPFQEGAPGEPIEFTTGIFQSCEAAEGECWEASLWAATNPMDPIQSDNIAFISVVFRDGSGVLLAEFPLNFFDSSSNVPSYTQYTTSGVAPAGTESVEIVIGFFQGATEPRGGSFFFDDVTLAVKDNDCPGDLTTTGTAMGQPGFGEPDGITNLSDLLFFVNIWNADLGSPTGNPGSIADVTTTGAGEGQPGFGVPDGNVDLSDLLFYVNQWNEGLGVCPG